MGAFNPNPCQTRAFQKTERGGGNEFSNGLPTGTRNLFRRHKLDGGATAQCLASTSGHTNTKFPIVVFAIGKGCSTDHYPSTVLGRMSSNILSGLSGGRQLPIEVVVWPEPGPAQQKAELPLFHPIITPSLNQNCEGHFAGKGYFRLSDKGMLPADLAKALGKDAPLIQEAILQIFRKSNSASDSNPELKSMRFKPPYIKLVVFEGQPTTVYGLIYDIPVDYHTGRGICGLWGEDLLVLIESSNTKTSGSTPAKTETTV